ncbi:amino acid ABC transporter membrane protein 2, PAAT family [Friedmanniella luteola]|uniref:Amino acid ABC transporter membrane protein 2, PAAT family n=1 Tax=Friedmanniella luteola TaxID=546871 RepID=A0A1H1R931_9ACTN|nr:amino acid ABC transporter permease [Friedmanniella luteola]SDS32287.1 amino acid ABC transporter membrane protein 2, PAAT family [Friedmanniella luteola]
MSAPVVLFDVPGPRARRTYRVVGVVAVLVLVALLVLVVRGLANPDDNQFTAEKWRPFLDPVTWTAYLLPGLVNTLKAAAIAVVLSVVVGLVLGVGRLSQSRVLRLVCGTYVEFFRSVPVLVMMIFSYYFAVFVVGITGDAASLFGVVAGLTLYNSAVIAELIRSGVHSLPRGQREAGLAVGLTPSQAMTAILLPQAVTAMLPSLLSQLVVILKDTALGYIINFSELIRGGQNLSTNFGNLIPTFIVLAAIFILINYSLTFLARLLERRLQRSAKGTPPPDPDDQAQVAPVGGGMGVGVL